MGWWEFLTKGGNLSKEGRQKVEDGRWKPEDVTGNDLGTKRIRD